MMSAVMPTTVEAPTGKSAAMVAATIEAAVVVMGRGALVVMKVVMRIARGMVVLLIQMTVVRRLWVGVDIIAEQEPPRRGVFAGSMASGERRETLEAQNATPTASATMLKPTSATSTTRTMAGVNTRRFLALGGNNRNLKNTCPQNLDDGN